jgi:predicted DNA-binding protein (MmcQ/YjbR family)
MTLETLRTYCLSKAFTSEHLPFDDKTLVFKVGTKMFALVDIDQGKSVNLKCDPERALELRESYSEIQPGYHMSKVHWNTVSLIDTLDNDFISALIDHSYDLVYTSLTKKEKLSLAGG